MGGALCIETVGWILKPTTVEFGENFLWELPVVPLATKSTKQHSPFEKS